MRHALRMRSGVAERFSFRPLLDELGDAYLQRLGKAPQDAQGRVMPPELEAREITAAHVGLLCEGFLTQATGRAQLLEPLL